MKESRLFVVVDDGGWEKVAREEEKVRRKR